MLLFVGPLQPNQKERWLATADSGKKQNDNQAFCHTKQKIYLMRVANEKRRNKLELFLRIIIIALTVALGYFQGSRSMHAGSSAARLYCSFLVRGSAAADSHNY